MHRVYSACCISPTCYIMWMSKICLCGGESCCHGRDSTLLSGLFMVVERAFLLRFSISISLVVIKNLSVLVEKI